jgi:probable addiction module antidote protein
VSALRSSKKSVRFEDHLNDELKDSGFAAEYINAAIEENDSEFLIYALNDVAKACGMSQLSEESGVNRQAIYKMLSENGNPSYKNIVKILEALGLELQVRLKKVC